MNCLLHFKRKNQSLLYATTRLRSATNALNDAKNVAINKVARDLVDVGKVIDTSVTWTRNNLNLGRQAITPDGTVYRIKETAENTHKVETNLKDFLSRFEGINLNGTRGINLGKAELEHLRKKWNVPETHTIAVGKTDVKGLEDLSFEGGSPKVRKEAGLPDLDVLIPDRPIKSSGKIPSATRHAEEGIANQFVEAVEKAGIRPEDVVGTLRMHQSNPSGVCPACLSGLGNPKKNPGIIKQLILKYPDLIIDVTSHSVEGAKVNGRLNFKVKNGVYIN